MKKEENEVFHLVIMTDEDVKLEINKQISELVEEQKSEFTYNGQSLYKLGSGHCFVRGFFTEYITKTGINAKYYVYGSWYINGEKHDYVNCEFIKTPKIERNSNPNPIDFKSFLSSFPAIKNIKPKTLAEDLISVKPKHI